MAENNNSTSYLQGQPTRGYLNTETSNSPFIIGGDGTQYTDYEDARTMPSFIIGDKEMRVNYNDLITDSQDAYFGDNKTLSDATRREIDYYLKEASKPENKGRFKLGVGGWTIPSSFGFDNNDKTPEGELKRRAKQGALDWLAHRISPYASEKINFKQKYMPGTGSLIGKKYFGGRGNANVGHWYDYDPYSTNETGFSTRGNYSRRKAFEEAVKEDLNKLKDPNSNYGNMVFGQNSTQRQDYINKYERFLNSVSTLGEGDENERQWIKSFDEAGFGTGTYGSSNGSTIDNSYETWFGKQEKTNQSKGPEDEGGAVAKQEDDDLEKKDETKPVDGGGSGNGLSIEDGKLWGHVVKNPGVQWWADSERYEGVDGRSMLPYVDVAGRVWTLADLENGNIQGGTYLDPETNIEKTISSKAILDDYKAQLDDRVRKMTNFGINDSFYPSKEYETKRIFPGTYYNFGEGINPGIYSVFNPEGKTYKEKFTPSYIKYDKGQIVPLNPTITKKNGSFSLDFGNGLMASGYDEKAFDRYNPEDSYLFDNYGSIVGSVNEIGLSKIPNNPTEIALATDRWKTFFRIMKDLNEKKNINGAYYNKWQIGKHGQVLVPIYKNIKNIYDKLVKGTTVDGNVAGAKELVKNTFGLYKGINKDGDEVYILNFGNETPLRMTVDKKTGRVSPEFKKIEKRTRFNKNGGILFLQEGGSVEEWSKVWANKENTDFDEPVNTKNYTAASKQIDDMDDRTARAYSNIKKSNERTSTGRTKTELGTYLSSEFNGQDANDMKQLGFDIDWREKNRFRGAAVNIMSILAPSLLGTVMGVTGTALEASADIADAMDGNMTWGQAAKNIGINLATDAVSIFGTGAVKAGSSAVKLGKWIQRLLLTAGAAGTMAQGPELASAAKKFINGDVTSLNKDEIAAMTSFLGTIIGIKKTVQSSERAQNWLRSGAKGKQTVINPDKRVVSYLDSKGEKRTIEVANEQLKDRAALESMIKKAETDAGRPTEGVMLSDRRGWLSQGVHLNRAKTDSDKAYTTTTNDKTSWGKSLLSRGFGDSLTRTAYGQTNAIQRAYQNSDLKLSKNKLFKWMPNATAINKRQEYLTNDSHSEYQYIYGNKENGKVVRSDKKLDDPNLVLITRDLTGMRHSLPKEDEVEFANMFKSKEGRKQLDEFILSMPKSERENVSYMDAFLEMKHGKEYLASIRNGVRNPENVKENYNILDDETSHVYKTQKVLEWQDNVEGLIKSSNKKLNEMEADANKKLESYNRDKKEAENAKTKAEKTEKKANELIENKKKEIESVESKLNELRNKNTIGNKVKFITGEDEIRFKTLKRKRNDLKEELNKITERANRGILNLTDKANSANKSLLNNNGKIEYDKKINEIDGLKDKLKRIQNKFALRENPLSDPEYQYSLKAIISDAKIRNSYTPNEYGLIGKNVQPDYVGPRRNQSANKNWDKLNPNYENKKSPYGIIYLQKGGKSKVSSGENLYKFNSNTNLIESDSGQNSIPLATTPLERSYKEINLNDKKGGKSKVPFGENLYKFNSNTNLIESDSRQNSIPLATTPLERSYKEINLNDKSENPIYSTGEDAFIDSSSSGPLGSSNEHKVSETDKNDLSPVISPFAVNNITDTFNFLNTRKGNKNAFRESIKKDFALGSPVQKITRQQVMNPDTYSFRSAVNDSLRHSISSDASANNNINNALNSKYIDSLNDRFSATSNDITKQLNSLSQNKFENAIIRNDVAHKNAEKMEDINDSNRKVKADYINNETKNLTNYATKLGGNISSALNTINNANYVQDYNSATTQYEHEVAVADRDRKEALAESVTEMERAMVEAEYNTKIADAMRRYKSNVGDAYNRNAKANFGNAMHRLAVPYNRGKFVSGNNNFSSKE